MSNLVYIPDDYGLGFEIIVNTDQIVTITEDKVENGETSILVNWADGRNTIERNQDGVFHKLFNAMRAQCQNS